MRKINMIIKHCGECPFCEYDSDYGMSYNSGYDCKNKKSNGSRIATDVGSRVPDLKNIPIPDWCGLPRINK